MALFYIDILTKVKHLNRLSKLYRDLEIKHRTDGINKCELNNITY